MSRACAISGMKSVIVLWIGLMYKGVYLNEITWKTHIAIAVFSLCDILDEGSSGAAVDFVALPQSDLLASVIRVWNDINQIAMMLTRKKTCLFASMKSLLALWSKKITIAKIDSKIFYRFKFLLIKACYKVGVRKEAK